MSLRWSTTFLFAVLALATAACSRQAPAPAPAAAPDTQTSADNGPDFGAVSVDIAPPKKKAVDIGKTTEWPEAKLESGKASISCSTDYVANGDGQAFTNLGFFSLLDVMLPCKEVGVVRLRYKGRVAGDLTTLIERVASMPPELMSHLQKVRVAGQPMRLHRLGEEAAGAASSAPSRRPPPRPGHRKGPPPRR